MNNKRNQKKKIVIFPGTNKSAFFRAEKEGKSSKERKKLYRIFANKETKILSPSFPRHKIESPIKKTPIINRISKKFPKILNLFILDNYYFLNQNYPKRFLINYRNILLPKLLVGLKKHLF